MSYRDLDPRHLKLISLYFSRYLVRGGTGLVFVMLVMTTGLLTAHLIITPVEQTKVMLAREEGREVEEEVILERLIEVARPAIEWVLGSNRPEEEGEGAGGRNGQDGAPESGQVTGEQWTSYLLDEQPALLSAILLIMLFALPFLIAMGCFNQFSGDVQSRGIRYQLLHADRSSIFFGRFLGTTLFTILMKALLVLIVVIYLGLKLDFYSWGELGWWGFRGIIALAVVTIPYVALCAWVSSLVDSPFGSLTVSTIIIGAVPLFALIGRNTWEPAENLTYLLPWGIQNYMLHPGWLQVLGTVVACLGYTVLFLFLGHRHFAKRDL